MSAIKPQKALAIINNRDLLEVITEKMKYHNLSADCIHGESTRQDRKRIMDAYQQGKIKLLLATDLATRGLDFVDIDVVFCVTASENPSDYLHKAGRTGRCGKDGMCISLISPKEIPLYQAYEKQLGITIKEKYLREGKLVD